MDKDPQSSLKQTGVMRALLRKAAGRDSPRCNVDRLRVVFRAVLPGRLPRRHAVASPDPACVGFVVAAVFGIVSLKIAVRTLYRPQLKILAFYAWQP